MIHLQEPFFDVNPRQEISSQHQGQDPGQGIIPNQHQGQDSGQGIIPSQHQGQDPGQECLNFGFDVVKFQ